MLGDAKGNVPYVKLHRHRNPTHREFITEWPEQIDVAVDSVEKIVFDVTSHRHGGLVPEAMMVTLPTAIAGGVIDGCRQVA